MRKIAIIGSGPAALALAAALDAALFEIHVFEKNAAPARKFLVAGQGGFNLTNAEPVETFISRYTPEEFMAPFIRAFSNTALCEWLQQLGIPTYTGSSGRIFPERGIKPVQVLNAILDALKKKNVRFHFGFRWTGGEPLAPRFESPAGEFILNSDKVCFALGGASWQVTGSDGSWTEWFSARGITVVPFQSSNCAVHIRWPGDFLQAHEGKPLKNIAVRCGDREKKGELVITKAGLEGGAVYFHSPCIRQQLDREGRAEIRLDLLPALSEAVIREKLQERGLTQTEKLRGLGLDKSRTELLKPFCTREEFTSFELLSRKIKSLPLEVNGLAPIDEAISTAGGIALDEVGPELELKKLPGVYVLGEMLDWDAPTGGYLLQACFSMGFYAGRNMSRA